MSEHLPPHRVAYRPAGARGSSSSDATPVSTSQMMLRQLCHYTKWLDGFSVVTAAGMPWRIHAHAVSDWAEAVDYVHAPLETSTTQEIKKLTPKR